MRLQTQLLVGLLLLSLAPLAVAGVYFDRAGAAMVEDRALQQLSSVAELQANRADAILDRSIERLDLVASRTQLRLTLDAYAEEPSQDKSERMGRIVTDARDSIDELRHIHVVDTNGTIAASTDDGAVGVNITDEEAYRLGLVERRADLFFVDRSGTLGLHLAGPLHLDGRLIGVLVIEADATSFLDMINDHSGLGETGETLLARRAADGDAIFLTPLRFDDTAALTRTVPASADDAAVNIALDGRIEQISHGTDYRGETVLAATQFLEGPGWGVVAKIDRSEALAPVTTLRLQIVAVVAVLGIGVVVLARLLAERLAQPVQELYLAAKRLNGGGLVAGRPEETNEVKVLAGAFEEMAERLIRANEELEAMVEARTRALAEANEDLAEAKRLAEQASLAKSAFLANMSHEIRTPMNAVIGLTSVVLDGELEPDQAELLRTVRASGEHLLTVINDILDLSKIEAGRVELERRPFALRQCIEEALDLVAPTASTKGLDLAYHIEDDVPKGVVGDSARIRQVVVNLLSNAVKFTEAGEVVVTVDRDTPTDRVDDLRPGEPAGVEPVDGEAFTVHIAVRDTGPGIEPARLEELFEPFTQADASVTRRFGGTGLGLTISRQLAELMGGRLWAESTPGEGSTFHVTFATRRVEVAFTSALERPSAALRARRVLAVDDNATSLKIISHYLHAWGMDAVTVQDPHEALALVEQGESFDLALLDHAMAGMDGATLARRLHEITDPDELPIIVITSLFDEGRAAFEGIGLSAFLHKPIKPSSLYDAIAQALHGEFRPSDVRDQGFDAAMGQRAPLRILVAEDNEVNQVVALTMLDRLGYEADLVADGNEAVDAVREGSYELVFMDISMPIVDGFEATARIRRELAPADQPRIVAMTAHASTEDRDRCLAAGMDDYLAKPVTVGALEAVLGRSVTALAGHGGDRGHRSSRAPQPGSPVPLVDEDRFAGLVDLLGPGPEGVGGIVDQFIEHAPATLASMREAVERGDHQALSAAAHRVRGEAVTVGATRLARVCGELEEGSRDAMPADARGRVDAVVSTWHETVAALGRR